MYCVVRLFIHERSHRFHESAPKNYFSRDVVHVDSCVINESYVSLFLSGKFFENVFLAIRNLAAYCTSHMLRGIKLFSRNVQKFVSCVTSKTELKWSCSYTLSHKLPLKIL